MEVRVRTLNVLALAALKDDVILLLHQDRREHVLMNYAYEIDRLEVEEQEALALFVSYSRGFLFLKKSNCFSCRLRTCLRI